MQPPLRTIDVQPRSRVPQDSTANGRPSSGALLSMSRFVSIYNELALHLMKDHALPAM